MNTKRQTIWLISMLSLMVVLSAYYLFSDSLEEINNASNQVMSDTDMIDVNDLTLEDGSAVSGTENSATLDEILQQVQAEANSGAAFFASMLLERNENLAKESERLMNIITDATQDTETISQALNELDVLEDMQAKVDHVETTLMKDFPNVIVAEGENDSWKVIVQSNKLEKSQAVSIVDLVMSELNVSQDKVVVQYMH